VHWWWWWCPGLILLVEAAGLTADCWSCWLVDLWCYGIGLFVNVTIVDFGHRVVSMDRSYLCCLCMHRIQY